MEGGREEIKKGRRREERSELRAWKYFHCQTFHWSIFTAMKRNHFHFVEETLLPMPLTPCVSPSVATGHGRQLSTVYG